MNSSPLNYITITTNIHMKLSMHINVCIPVTIKHVKNVFVDTMIMLAIFISLYNKESFRSSNKLEKFFKIKQLSSSVRFWLHLVSIARSIFIPNPLTQVNKFLLISLYLLHSKK